MKATMVTVILGTLLLCSMGATHAGPRDLTGITGEAVVDSTLGAECVAVELPSALSAGEADLLELTFQADLGVGEEVELWVAGSTETLPWDQEGQHRIGIWTADERTGTLVRFDVTELQELVRTSREPLRLLIRRSPDEDGEVANLSLKERPEFRVVAHEWGR